MLQEQDGGGPLHFYMPGQINLCMRSIIPTIKIGFDLIFGILFIYIHVHIASKGFCGGPKTASEAKIRPQI